MNILDKDTIEKEIIVHLLTAKRGYACSVPLWQVVGAIIYNQYRNNISIIFSCYRE